MVWVVTDYHRAKCWCPISVLIWLTLSASVCSGWLKKNGEIKVLLDLLVKCYGFAFQKLQDHFTKSRESKIHVWLKTHCSLQKAFHCDLTISKHLNISSDCILCLEKTMVILLVLKPGNHWVQVTQGPFQYILNTSSAVRHTKAIFFSVMKILFPLSALQEKTISAWCSKRLHEINLRGH